MMVNSYREKQTSYHTAFAVTVANAQRRKVSHIFFSPFDI